MNNRGMEEGKRRDAERIASLTNLILTHAVAS